MKNFFIVLTLLVSLVATGQPTKAQIQQVADAKKEVKKMKGAPFPSFELETIQGTKYTKKDLEGKIVLINLWFSRCRPCIMEMPEMNEMVEEFAEDDVVFLAPTFDSEELVSNFLEKRPFSYEIVADVKDFCLELNVRSYPTHFVLNRSGVIEKVVIGYSAMTVGSLRKSIRKLLKSG